MPVFIRPARVVVEEGGGGLAAAAAVVALAVLISALGAIVADIVTALLISAAAAVLGSLGVLAIVLRRNGVALVQRPAVVAPARARVLPARSAAAISASRPRLVVPGEVISETERKHRI